MEDWPQHSKKRFSPGRSLVFEYGARLGVLRGVRVGVEGLKKVQCFPKRLKESNFEFGMDFGMTSFSGWWFQTFFIFTPTWGDDPI